ncbi:radical SAM protein [uncultured Clostridium sp.]|jgi:MoaA/NifB/PqqE/SkfB family radical SAM enzyme|uniref:radical SAM/SPASM domain-containing protein n=1 Tax=uncultured Clostridium sp. TaxID=59620 RepID=UPI00261CDA9C|nr:radical SAM protein [uncultured Clostridium sp.]
MKNNMGIIMRMGMNKDILKNMLSIHKKFKQNKNYKLANVAKCGMNVIKNDRLVIHDGNFIINSFLPPINSKAYNSIAMAVPGDGAEFFYNHTTGKRNAPISTYIAVTARCMYKCWHCSAKRFIADENNCKDEISTENMKKIINDLQNLGVGIIGFTGGEPLLRKDLEEIISFVDQRSTSYLFTNGFGLTLEKAKGLKKAGLFGVGISIDSITESVHDEKRGHKGAYKIAIEAIKNCKQAGLYTMAQTVCTREMLNAGEIFELNKFLKTLDIDEVRILEPIPCGSLLEKNDAILSKDEKKKLIDLHSTLNKSKEYPKVSVFPYIESKDQFGCGAGVQHSYIDNKGDFLPCDFVPESFGNVLEEDIKDIWTRMHEKFDKPKCYCYAKKCDKCKSEELPKYYQLLAGK